MANLTLIDRLQLVKAGYKAKQIEEMIIKDASEPLASEEPAENTSKGEAEPEQAKDQVETPKAEEKEDAPDYKKLFEDLQKSNEDLQKKLEAAQALNAKADVSGNTIKKDAQSVVNDIFKDIL